MPSQEDACKLPHRVLTRCCNEVGVYRTSDRVLRKVRRDEALRLCPRVVVGNKDMGERGLGGGDERWVHAGKSRGQLRCSVDCLA